MRKAIIVLGVLLMAAAGVNAADSPVDKGSVMLGGSVYFMTQSGDLWENGDGDGLTTIAFDPGVGFFVAPGIFLGADVIFESQSQGDYDQSVLGLAPAIGYYFNLDPSRAEAKGAAYPYIKAFFSYQKYTFGDDEDSMTGFGGMGGINLMLSNAVAVDIGVKFESDSFDPDWSPESLSGTSLMFGFGISAFIY